MTDFLDRIYYNNTVQDYLIALGIIVVGLIVVRIFKKLILRTVGKWAKRTETTADDFIIEGIERFGIPALYIIVVYSGINYLALTERVEKIVNIALTVAITFLAVRLISAVVHALLRGYMRRRTEDETKIKQVSGLMLIINLVLWMLGLVFLFDNMGYDVTAIVTGLGIGGIAVALAAQNILGDLFNYFVIFFDRPFEIGDFIVLDDKKGVVEYIGVKTTRLRSLTGEQLVVSNSDLTNSRIHNFKRMNTRRIAFTLGVTYNTPLEKVKQLPQILKDIIDREELTNFDRAHFSSYGDSALKFEVVYFVLDSEYNVYMDVQQSINLRIFEAFEKMGVEFAFPTQTIYLEKAGEKE